MKHWRVCDLSKNSKGASTAQIIDESQIHKQIKFKLHETRTPFAPGTFGGEEKVKLNLDLNLNE